MSQVVIDSLAPDFELNDFAGKPFRLSMLRGKKVVVVFNRGFL
jgi:peroxiredoxin